MSKLEMRVAEFLVDPSNTREECSELRDELEICCLSADAGVLQGRVASMGQKTAE